jgi:20S proteasome alpha/beta subunit
MTIGIGVLASDISKPDHVVLLADTQGSFGEVYSMNRFHKLFQAPDVRLCAAAADRIDRAAELFDVIRTLLKTDYMNKGTYGNVLDAVHAASDIYNRSRFRFDILPKYARMPHSLPEPFDSSHLTPELLDEWRKFYFGCHMIVGGFDKSGQAFLFRIGGRGEDIDNFSFPGYVAIGSGEGNAMFWLSYRNHNLGLCVKHSAYHAFEAKIMAESSPFVNEKLDLLIANRDKQIFISDSKPLTPNAPFTLTDLRNMFGQYGPRDTGELTLQS